MFKIIIYYLIESKNKNLILTTSYRLRNLLSTTIFNIYQKTRLINLTINESLSNIHLDLYNWQKQVDFYYH